MVGIREQLDDSINVNINKQVKVLHDGRQFMIKIPNEIANFFKLEKGDKIKLTVDIPSEGTTTNRFEIIKN